MLRTSYDANRREKHQLIGVFFDGSTKIGESASLEIWITRNSNQDTAGTCACPRIETLASKPPSVNVHGNLACREGKDEMRNEAVVTRTSEER